MFYFIMAVFPLVTFLCIAGFSCLLFFLYGATDKARRNIYFVNDLIFKLFFICAIVILHFVTTFVVAVIFVFIHLCIDAVSGPRIFLHGNCEFFILFIYCIILFTYSPSCILKII